MKKLSFSLFIISLLTIVFFFSCSAEEKDTSTAPAAVQSPEPEPEPVEYTLSVSTSEGGSVSSEGGTYAEGTEVTITATANEGYEFIGWEGSNETRNELTIPINSNISLSPIFQTIQTDESLYSSGDIVPIEPIVFYARELVVNGIRLIAAAEIGGQQAVPDFWIYKTARVFKLLIDKDSEGIDTDA